MSDLPKPTSTHLGLAAYIREQTGYEADVMSVSLAVRLSKQYRESPDNVTRRESRRAEREAYRAGVEDRKKARKLARAEKLRQQAEQLAAEAEGAVTVVSYEPLAVPDEAQVIELPVKKAKKPKGKKAEPEVVVVVEEGPPFEVDDEPAATHPEGEPTEAEEAPDIVVDESSDGFTVLDDNDDEESAPEGAPAVTFQQAQDDDWDDDDDF